MSNLFDRPGASVLRSIFEEAYQEQELDMLSAQQMLEVLQEFASRAELEEFASRAESSKSHVERRISKLASGSQIP